ncbi:MAG: hypothetical protein ACRDRO_20140 [Pseudonocardiaceae bacterium]
MIFQAVGGLSCSCRRKARQVQARPVQIRHKARYLTLPNIDQNHPTFSQAHCCSDYQAPWLASSPRRYLNKRSKIQQTMPSPGGQASEMPG